MGSELILQTRNLGKRYKNRWAVQRLNLEVYRGDVFGFLGPNGAGKSTTIRMILSLISPTTGDVRLFGQSLLSRREAALASVGGIVEKPDFYLYLSAYKNLEILGALNRGVEKRRIMEVLDLVGLSDRAHDKVKTYSHGMKQRLGIAQALLSDPELVVLDEPTGGLDPHGMKDVRELIFHLSRNQNKTIFLSSHLLSEVEQVANRMAIINKGELVVQGEVQKLLREGENYVLVRGRPLFKIRTILKRNKKMVAAFKQRGNSYEVSVALRDIPLLNKELVRGGVAVESLIPRRSLEDFFISMTESSEQSTASLPAKRERAAMQGRSFSSLKP